VRLFFTLLVLTASLLPTRDAQSAAALERGAAITDPLALRELDRNAFGLGRILLPNRVSDAPLTNNHLFALPSIAPVRQAIDAEFAKYVGRQKAVHPNQSIGVGSSYELQLFDRALLDSADTRFVLAGIINRMDRAYVSEASCGEIRLIYRLTRTDTAGAGEGAASPRLPMTLNVVFKAKGDAATDTKGRSITCAEIARRWLMTADLAVSGGALAERLLAEDGPLALVLPENIRRVETNLQVVHAPKSVARDFRTDYLLKVFDYNAASAAFEEVPLENQLDTERILADEKLRREFKAWLFEPANFTALDRGTVVIPKEFLATAALAPTPVGFTSPNLTSGLLEGGGSAEAVFTDRELKAMLQQLAERGTRLQNIRSVAGFERRLSDISCSGCHQTRAIGGFHFPGVDWLAERPDNSRVVPASPHFFGDQIRRRDVLADLRDGKTPDYSRGFANRPQGRGKDELAGTGYEDGWGAHCYARRARAADNDSSFSSWTCASGLACQTLGSSRFGMCFVGSPR
jgi:hypothetical protein